AEVVLAGSASQAFDLVRRIEAEEGRFFIHPFNGYHTILGTATLGYEWATQTPDLDAVIVPIGAVRLDAVHAHARIREPQLRG
ncbi:pyridoxal-phosphate dependent enzyme, partial [Burkholderia cenocepacia]|uniref:pyridoxal-phosphate dependent enzyme n=1 Tax=Burkholderia cenocepacia TaxID=95486 RepID=UPI0024B79A1E